VRGRTVRVYSTHLGTFADIGSGARDDQLASILADAAPFDAVIVGGDMNSASAPRAALRQGFAWPTADGPRSTRFGRWDHLLFRGFATVDRAATITSIGDVSDHLPVVTSAMLAGVQPNVALPVK
jgi:endonuclease/exonuclease/phosphatase family metal-dependent hydrolase